MNPFSYFVGNGVSAPILKKFVSPTYPPDALKAHYGGSAPLRVIVGDDGVPLAVQALRSQDFGLSRAATDAVQQWRFAPGQLKGRPVVVNIVVEIWFDRERGTIAAGVQ